MTHAERPNSQPDAVLGTDRDPRVRTYVAPTRVVCPPLRRRRLSAWGD